MCPTSLPPSPRSREVARRREEAVNRARRIAAKKSIVKSWRSHRLRKLLYKRTVLTRNLLAYNVEDAERDEHAFQARIAARKEVEQAEHTKHLAVLLLNREEQRRAREAEQLQLLLQRQLKQQQQQQLQFHLLQQFQQQQQQQQQRQQIGKDKKTGNNASRNSKNLRSSVNNNLNSNGAPSSPTPTNNLTSSTGPIQVTANLASSVVEYSPNKFFYNSTNDSDMEGPLQSTARFYLNEDTRPDLAPFSSRINQRIRQGKLFKPNDWQSVARLDEEDKHLTGGYTPRYYSSPRGEQGGRSGGGYGSYAGHPSSLLTKDTVYKAVKRLSKMQDSELKAQLSSIVMRPIAVVANVELRAVPDG